MSSKRNNWNVSISLSKRVEAWVRENLLPSIHLHTIQNNLVCVKNPDLKVPDSIEIEVKTAFTPYPSSPTPTGLNADDHLTIDVANVREYSPDTIILFVASYPKPSVYLTTARKLQEILQEEPWRIYTRSFRSSKDKVSKMGVSASTDCENITNLFPPDIIKEIFNLDR